ncbi:serine hydrolase domain-containing protein [Legionella hackeliae]|uniref:Serine-type D-Ala-D-Ala carboxypeptidase n=1 Tax=Legionella hackeliae TaxID=449 RepID=A0A0A8URI5_LEGHA|nr:serine hydrolase domain-containing protein [Legionella hackeliae]KTD13206.1 serine-type D-Ala-D-Ala carboxypeptidase [Legionella hackeliae]CEK11480.1 Serine-type D-Ala-D-Ala carboxypeptidase [Legionella hackeliae]STX48249.1 serine-type D-Ala-D-Ala carboxypeptidase [Legionella hackeliae]
MANFSCFKYKAVYFFFIFSVLFCQLVSARTPIAEGLQSIVNKTLSNSETPGAVLLVSSPELGTIIITAGVANKKTHEPMKATNNFRIASMSKTFLAATILKLIEQNKLTLNDKIAPLLAESIDLKKLPNSKDVTIRELLQMRSGIPNYVKFDTYYDLVHDMIGEKWTPQSCIKIVYNKKPSFIPDHAYEYSNTNYLLLQLIVEKITGQSFATAIRQQILNPLQLNNTFIEITESAPPHQLTTHGYQFVDDEVVDVTNYNDGLGLGDSGMVSTAGDINRFIRALLNEKVILRANSLKQMLRTKDDYGLGIYGEEINGKWAWSHNGLSSGFQGQYYYFPHEKLSIVYLTNYFDTDTIDKVVPKVVKYLTKYRENKFLLLEKSSNPESRRVIPWFNLR